MVGSFITSDVSAFLTKSDFGEVAVWNGVEIEAVIFDDGDVEVQIGEGPIEIVHRTMITGRSEDFLGIAERDPISVNSKTFTVRNWKDDGTGVIEIFLDASTTNGTVLE